jgi:hypothetical protein
MFANSQSGRNMFVLIEIISSLYGYAAVQKKSPPADRRALAIAAR